MKWFNPICAVILIVSIDINYFFSPLRILKESFSKCYALCLEMTSFLKWTMIVVIWLDYQGSLIGQCVWTFLSTITSRAAL